MLTKFEYSRQISVEVPSINFHKNLSSERRVVPCRAKDGQRDGCSDITELTVAFRNLTKATIGACIFR